MHPAQSQAHNKAFWKEKTIKSLFFRAAHAQTQQDYNPSSSSAGFVCISHRQLLLVMSYPVFVVSQCHWYHWCNFQGSSSAADVIGVSSVFSR